MGSVAKTVFVSYRHANTPWALAISQNLIAHGYDVFLDFTGIASGDFERIILENIKGRAHFLLVLTPSSLERVSDPDDWLRREIECALAERRNIVPLFLEGFDFGTPAIANHLTGKLAELRRYNGLSVPAAYFEEAMERLRQRHLNVSLDGVLHPLSTCGLDAAREQQNAARAAPSVQANELTANEWFERAYKAAETEEEERCYSEAIRLKPDYYEAYNNRGVVRFLKADLDGALSDFDTVLNLKVPWRVYLTRGLKPRYSTHFGRGVARHAKGDLDGALADFNEAVRQKPDFALAYNSRGVARQDKGDLDGAMADFEKATSLDPTFEGAQANKKGLAVKLLKLQWSKVNRELKAMQQRQNDLLNTPLSDLFHRGTDDDESTRGR